MEYHPLIFLLEKIDSYLGMQDQSIIDRWQFYTMTYFIWYLLHLFSWLQNILGSAPT